MILILDDNARRLENFGAVAPQLGEGWRARTARSAQAWIEEARAGLADARLVSLDHDLDPADAGVADPGTGRQAAEWLAAQRPVCPVIIHTSNTDAAWGMFNVLTRTKWLVEVVHHVNDDTWIAERWLPVARRLVAARAPVCEKHPPDPDWLLAALASRPADRYQALEKELAAWPPADRARALFRIALSRCGHTQYRAADYLLEDEPVLPCSCEEAMRAIAASPLDLDAQSLVAYVVTQYGKQEVERIAGQLADEFKGHPPQGFSAFTYFIRSPTMRLGRQRGGDWRDRFPDA